MKVVLIAPLSKRRVYPSHADKVAEVNAFLAELDADPARIPSLCDV